MAPLPRTDSTSRARRGAFTKRITTPEILGIRLRRRTSGYRRPSAAPCMTASASPQADIPRDLRCDASRPSWDRRSARAASPAINGHGTRFGRVGRLMRRVQGAAVIVTPRRTRRRHNDSNRSHSNSAASPVPPSRVPSSASDPRPSCYPTVRARMCQATGGSGCGPPGSVLLSLPLDRHVGNPHPGRKQAPAESRHFRVNNPLLLADTLCRLDMRTPI